MEIGDNNSASILEFLASEALRKRDYESAARYFRHLAVHFGIINNESNKRRFSIKAGECYMQAAEGFGKSTKAIMLYFRATEAFKEGGDLEMARFCGLKMWEQYLALRENVSRLNSEDIHAFKVAGDHFVSNGNPEKAALIYQDAAERALKNGKLLLAGGLFKDAGNCNQKLGNHEDASSLYIKAADAFFQCQEYFEAAWSYCEAGFLLIRLGRFEEALELTKRAEESCYKGRIEIFLKDLIRICKLLSQGHLEDAVENWRRIKAKLSKEYIQLIESSFQSIKSSRKC
ncbi:MAG: tetratricopeptide repeat protein [Candidatus Bathyarchaeia archaeon]